MKKIRDFQDKLSSRDPDIIFHNGLYYGCFASANNTLSIICGKTIDELSTAEPQIVYRAEEGKMYSKELWAPELHVIDEKCYIYVACDDGNNHNHRMYVLENNSNDPLDIYSLHGKISDSTDKWAIDGTIMKHNNKMYFVWSGWEGDENICQNLYIAEMKSPYQFSSERFLFSTPEYEWEKLGATGSIEDPFINEGPYAFTLNNQTYLSYSGAGSWCEDYCIAILKLTGDNPLDINSWEKLPSPVFSSNHMVKGAGHCSVIVENDFAHVFFHAWEKDETIIQWNKVAFWHGILRLIDGQLVIE